MLLSTFDTIGNSTLIMANIMPTAPPLAASSSSSSTASSRSSRSTQTMYNGLNGAAAPDPTESIDMDVVPPYHPSKTLVLCFDGTGDQFDTDNSNVVLLFSMLMKDRPSEQLVYYQAGIGTYTIPEIATPMWAKFSETLDEMLAWSLHAHVMGGYEFLMTNYQAGDKICLFGFSRGAYTARALAGMIHKVGLLPKSNHQQVPFAYKMFTRTDELGWKQSTAFKKAFSMDVPIDFIGVWDTVCSVGLIPHTLPFTSSNSAIRVFRHALSLDEHRAKFKANHYNRPTDDENALGTQRGDMPASGDRWRFVSKAKKGSTDWEAQFSAQEGHHEETDVLEVWFAGCHCDVGGGSVSNENTQNLARIPLRWMIRQCFLTNTGIRFHAELLKTIGLDPASLYPVVTPRPPAIYSIPMDHVRDSSGSTLAEPESVVRNEEEEDYMDALEPIYDELKLAPVWWILEVVPLEYRYQDAKRQWHRRIRMNLGHGRKVLEHEPFNVHRSVDIRLKAKDLPGGPYKPNAIFTEEQRKKIQWVD